MSIKETIIYLLIAAVVATLAIGLTTHQVNFDTLIIFCFIAVPVVTSYYFSSRKSAEPTKAEKTLALTWLLTRRVVSFLAAIFFFCTSIILILSSEAQLYKLCLAFVTFSLSAFCIWVGVYGQGWQRGALKDDVAHHKQNKDRYKWPW